MSATENDGYIFKVKTSELIRQILKQAENLEMPQDIRSALTRMNSLAEQSADAVRDFVWEVMETDERSSGESLSPEIHEMLLQLEEVSNDLGGSIEATLHANTAEREARREGVRNPAQTYRTPMVERPKSPLDVARDAMRVRAGAHYLEHYRAIGGGTEGEWRVLGRAARDLMGYEEAIQRPDPIGALITIESLAGDGQQLEYEYGAWVRDRERQEQEFFSKIKELDVLIKEEPILQEAVLVDGDPAAIQGLYLTGIELDWPKIFNNLVKDNPEAAMRIRRRVQKDYSLVWGEADEKELLDTWIKVNPASLYSAVEKEKLLDLPYEFRSTETRERLFESLLEQDPYKAEVMLRGSTTVEEKWGRLFKAYLRHEIWKEAARVVSEGRAKASTPLSPFEWQVWIEGFLKEDNIHEATKKAEEWPAPAGAALDKELIKRALATSSKSSTRVDIIRTLVPFVGGELSMEEVPNRKEKSRSR